MLAAAVPALSVHWSSANDSRVIPTSQSARVVADVVARQFPGAGTQPLTVAIAAPRSSAAAVADGRPSRRRAARDQRARSTPAYLGAGTWTIQAQLSGDQTGSRAQRDVKLIRDIDAPFPIHVTGRRPSSSTSRRRSRRTCRSCSGLLALLTFAVLWLMTDSVVLPIKAIAMNVLTVGAALTSVVVIFQHGNLTEPARLHPRRRRRDELVRGRGGARVRAVDRLRRVPARADQGAARRRRRRSRGGRRPGSARPGGWSRAAAILLAVAIGAFSTSEISFIQQIGVTVVTGVLVDAFIVRSLLVPSLMGLLGQLELVVAGSGCTGCTRGSLRPRPAAAVATPRPDACLAIALSPTV